MTDTPCGHLAHNLAKKTKPKRKHGTSFCEFSFHWTFWSKAVPQEEHFQFCSLYLHVSEVTVGAGVVSTGTLYDGAAPKQCEIAKIKISFKGLIFQTFRL